MNTPNPLIPQGTIPIRSRSHVRIAVFSILAVHVVLLGALLLQGCKRTTQDEAVVSGTNDSLMATWVEPTNPTPVYSAPAPPPPLPPAPVAVETTAASHTVVPPPAASYPATVVEPPVVTPPPSLPTSITPPTPAGSATVHVVVRNDSFSSLSKKYNVSVRAIAEANPGVESARLKLGQTLNIPAPTVAAPAAVAGNRNGATPGGRTYVVKSGDNLIRIAKAHGTTAGKLRAANNLRTDAIKVGDKLIIPANGGAGRSAGDPVLGLDSTAPAPRFIP